MTTPGDRPQQLISDILTGRLRTERVLRDTSATEDRRKPTVDRKVADAQAAAILSMALADLGEENAIPIEALAHCLAAVLVTARQSFFQVNDLSDRRLQETMPLISHLSVLAESMVDIGDRAEAQAERATRSAHPDPGPNTPKAGGPPHIGLRRV